MTYSLDPDRSIIMQQFERIRQGAGIYKTGVRAKHRPIIISELSEEVKKSLYEDAENLESIYDLLIPHSFHNRLKYYELIDEIMYYQACLKYIGEDFFNKHGYKALFHATHKRYSCTWLMKMKQIYKDNKK